MLKKRKIFLKNAAVEIKKLNLGSGIDYREGWINLDLGNKNIYGKKIKVDVIHDLNKFPYPFSDNYFEEIWMDQVLEHLEEPLKVMKELIRISKDNAIITVRVPHFSHFKAFYDPTHKHFFSLDSINLMNYDCEIIKKEFEISDNPFVKMIGKIFTLSPKMYERFLYGYFPVLGIEWVLRVKK